MYAIPLRASTQCIRRSRHIRSSLSYIINTHVVVHEAYDMESHTRVTIAPSSPSTKEMVTVTVMHALLLEITKWTDNNILPTEKEKKEILEFFGVVVDGWNEIECARPVRAFTNSNFHLIVSLSRLTSIAKSIGSMANTIVSVGNASEMETS